MNTLRCCEFNKVEDVFFIKKLAFKVILFKGNIIFASAIKDKN
jgi:hypothetical protein